MVEVKQDVTSTALNERIVQLVNEIIKQNNSPAGNSLPDLDRPYLTELVAHVYKTACCDCMVMLEDCTGLNLRDAVKK